MPVRSLNSSILKWPDAQVVDAAARLWAREMRSMDSDVVKIGYYGSYARGDWGVGSDIDLIVIVKSSNEPFGSRYVHWDRTKLPVPSDLIVYTEEEWDALYGSRFYETVMREAVWLEGGREGENVWGESGTRRQGDKETR